MGLTLKLLSCLITLANQSRDQVLSPLTIRPGFRAIQALFRFAESLVRSLKLRFRRNARLGLRRVKRHAQRSERRRKVDWCACQLCLDLPHPGLSLKYIAHLSIDLSTHHDFNCWRPAFHMKTKQDALTKERADMLWRPCEARHTNPLEISAAPPQPRHLAINELLKLVHGKVGALRIRTTGARELSNSPEIHSLTSTTDNFGFGLLLRPTSANPDPFNVIHHLEPLCNQIEMGLHFTIGRPFVAFLDQCHSATISDLNDGVARPGNRNQFLPSELDDPIIAPCLGHAKQPADIAGRDARGIHQIHKPQNAVIERREGHLLVDIKPDTKRCVWDRYRLVPDQSTSIKTSILPKHPVLEDH